MNPFNTAQYGLLLHMYAYCTGFEPGTLLVQITDAHIYSDQMTPDFYDMLNKYLSPSGEELLPFPTLEIKSRGQKYLQDFEYSDFKVHGYYAEETLRFPLTLVGGY